MNQKESSSNNAWSSKIGFILASAGSAVGLGNIWRFPYLVAEHSGGTFIFLYLLNCISQSFEQNSKDCELLFEQLLQIFSE